MPAGGCVGVSRKTELLFKRCWVIPEIRYGKGPTVLEELILPQHLFAIWQESLFGKKEGGLS